MGNDYYRMIERLYMQMYEGLFAYARCSLPSDSLAEEAVQETFCIACRKQNDLCSSSNPEGWLINTLKYVLANMARNLATAKRMTAEYSITEYTEGASSQSCLPVDVIYQDICHTEEFTLLKEFVLENKSYPELAQARNISETTCRKRVQRAKEKLRKILSVDVTKSQAET